MPGIDRLIHCCLRQDATGKAQRSVRRGRSVRRHHMAPKVKSYMKDENVIIPGELLAL